MLGACACVHADSGVPTAATVAAHRETAATGHEAASGGADGGQARAGDEPLGGGLPQGLRFGCTSYFLPYGSLAPDGPLDPQDLVRPVCAYVCLCVLFDVCMVPAVRCYACCTACWC